MKSIFRTLLLLLVLLVLGCNSSSVKDGIDIIDGVERKPIDVSRMGVNAFVNDQRFGSIEAQFQEVRDVLKLKHVRILMAWNDQVQPSRDGPINFSFYDDIAEALPSGVDAFVVLTDIPSWMQNPANWIGNDPRRTFVDLWVRRVVRRYRGNGRIVGFQIWNEPNMSAAEQPENGTLGLDTSPENYVAMLARAYSEIQDSAPGKLTIAAATTAINQNYPDALNYNRAMRDSGATEFMDIWAIHLYGRQFENIVRRSGVADFLNGIDKPIWVTESGAQGVNQQRGYVEQMWPYISERVEGIRRFYYYQFVEGSSPANTYGLRNLSQDAPLSDLYIYLRDR